jgi:diguanylate cyclase (GGDEF)-like protein
VLFEGTARPHWSAVHIDIDRLHVVNEKFGRYVGDAVLRQFGEFVRRQLTPGALGARISGDRFAVVIPETLTAAETFAETLRAGVEQLARADGEARPPISISVGVAPLERPAGTLTHALSAGDGVQGGGAIAQLARRMSITTVAEYAETEDILEAVRELRVDYAQGFAIHRPQALGELPGQLVAGQDAATALPHAVGLV